MLEGLRSWRAQQRARFHHSLVDDVFDVVMHGLVRPSFVWLYVKGHLQSTRGCMC